MGDICKIIHTDSLFNYPPKSDEEDWSVGLFVIIKGSYYQECGCMLHLLDDDGNRIKELRNLRDYKVIAPRHLNPSCFNIKGEFVTKGMRGSQEPEWAWVAESQMKFVRKPTEDEVML